MRVFVTGGTGYIGSVLIPLLIEKGYDVTALDRGFLNRGDTLSRFEEIGVKYLKDDIRYFDPNLLRDYDAVVDLAALSNDPSGDLDPLKTWDINFIGRSRVARLAKKTGVVKYIVSSSCSVYGFREDIADEFSKPNPLTTYAQANIAIEQDTLILKDSAFSPTALRFATAFGYSPRMRFDIAINAMTLYALKTGKLRVMRDGTQYRPFVHVKDISTAVLLVLDSDPEKTSGEVFNIGSDDQNAQLRVLADSVVKILGLKDKDALDWYGDPDTRSYRASFEKARESLNFRTRVSIEDGIREITNKIRSGELDDYPESHTVEHYKELLEAKDLLDRYGYSLNGKLL